MPFGQFDAVVMSGRLMLAFAGPNHGGAPGGIRTPDTWFRSSVEWTRCILDGPW
jgi:hypothetical protein